MSVEDKFESDVAFIVRHQHSTGKWSRLDFKWNEPGKGIEDVIAIIKHQLAVDKDIVRTTIDIAWTP